tara:strand:+ start:1439 stop:1807 length:369 start_codon:yes stop_codon:yes gene_type:complete
MGKKTCNGSMSRRITVVRRTTISSQSDSAEPVTTYADVFSVRANIKTNGGVNEWSRVRVGDLDATHTFTIRHTTIAFDARDRVKDGAGNLYKILKIDDVNEQGRELKIQCARAGEQNEAIAA